MSSSFRGGVCPLSVGSRTLWVGGRGDVCAAATIRICSASASQIRPRKREVPPPPDPSTPRHTHPRTHRRCVGKPPKRMAVAQLVEVAHLPGAGDAAAYVAEGNSFLVTGTTGHELKETGSHIAPQPHQAHEGPAPEFEPSAKATHPTKERWGRYAFAGPWMGLAGGCPERSGGQPDGWPKKAYRPRRGQKVRKAPKSVSKKSGATTCA